MAVFAVFLALLSLGLSFVNAVFRLFGINLPLGRKKRDTEVHSESQPQKKRYADGEGEYVDFEEV